MRSASRLFYNTSEKSWLFVLVCLGFAGFGLFQMMKGISVLNMAAASAKWPMTQGHITKSTIKWNQHSNGDASSAEPVIMYSFTVDGRSYTGNGIFPGLGVQSIDLARMIASRYPEGSAHNVYYLPSDPATAYLEQGIQLCSFLNLLLGSVLFLFGAPSVAACYFIPKYGRPKANGKSYTLPSSHPFSKVVTISILLMGLQFVALMYLCYRGYTVEL